jgi:hypothetical protein
VRIAHVCFQATSKKTRAERKKRAKKKRQQRSLMSQQEERTATLAKFAAKRKHESCRARSDDQKNQDRYRGRGWHRQTAAVAVSHAVIVSSCLPAGLSGSGRWGCGREGVTSQGRFAAAAVAADTVLKRCKRRAFSCRPAGFSKSRRSGISRSHISTQFDPSVLLMGEPESCSDVRDQRVPVSQEVTSQLSLIRVSFCRGSQILQSHTQQSHLSSSIVIQLLKATAENPQSPPPPRASNRPAGSRLFASSPPLRP